MRKIKMLLIALLCCVLLAGCTMPTEVTQKIEDIGIVTLESGAAIEAAEESYEAMFPLLKYVVQNYSLLESARETYDGMVAANEQMLADLDAIGQVTVESEAALAQLRRKYADYTDEYFPEEFLQVKQQLEELEKQHRQCVLEAKYQEAEGMFDRGEFAQAIKVLDDLMGKTEQTALYAYCKALKENCRESLELAEQAEVRALLDAGDPLGALKKLDSIDRSFPDGDAYEELEKAAHKQLEKNRPKNGKVLKKTVSGGSNVFKVKSNIKDTDYCIKLESVSNPEKYILLYVRGGKTASVKVPNGTYKIKYVTGEFWLNTQDYFYPRNYFYEFDKTANFKSTKKTYTSVVITLGGVKNGNLNDSIIDDDEF